MVLAAGDTFRAAAAEQLEEWARRSGADIVRGQDEKARPGTVLYNVRQGWFAPGLGPWVQGWVGMGQVSQQVVTGAH